jgi:hypothetical protein
MMPRDREREREEEEKEERKEGLYHDKCVPSK